MKSKSSKQRKTTKILLSLVGLIVVVVILIYIVNLQKNSQDILSKYQDFDAIPANDFYKLVEEAKNNDDIVIIDVRTPQEFSQGHIEGAVNINLYDADFEKKISNLDKNKTYLLYCRSGRRSDAAKQIFARLGFGKVYDLRGGILSWNQNSLPLVVS